MTKMRTCVIGALFFTFMLMAPRSASALYAYSLLD